VNCSTFLCVLRKKLHYRQARLVWPKEANSLESKLPRTLPAKMDLGFSINPAFVDRLSRNRD
jgi:hypothetical protein